MQGREIKAEVVQKLSPEIREVLKKESGNLKTKASVGDIGRVLSNSGSNAVHNRDQPKDNTSYFR